MKMLACSGVLLSVAALTVVLIRSVLPFDPIDLLLPQLPAAVLLGRFVLACVMFVLASPLIGGCFALAPQLSIFERSTSIGTLLSSWRLTRTAWRAVFSLMLVLDGLMVLPLLLPASVPLLESAMPMASRQISVLIGLGTLVFGALAVVMVPFQAAATTPLYSELRRRSEGVDLEQPIGMAALSKAEQSDRESS